LSIRLSLAVRIGESATALLKSVQIRDDKNFLGDHGPDGGHVGVEPILLALSMELALKAWWAFDHDSQGIPKTHNLKKLFDKLLPESRDKLRTEFRRCVAPHHTGLFIRCEIDDILSQYSDTFLDWRYLHELKGGLSFDRRLFEDTLELVLLEFGKRYRENPVPSWDLQNR
jgi:hypothetical protein